MYEPQALVRSDASSAAGGRPIDRSVVASIRDASQATGMDFGYLMAQAAQESSFEPAAKTAGSTASGLYQFTEGTWLQMMHDYGAKYGYGAMASAIHGSPAAGYHVSDPTLRQQILSLRDDPHAAASLGAEYARANGTYLSQSLGHAPSATDLYMAHFLGPAGATQFLKAAASNPGTSAASLLPQAAAANPSVFYDPHGNALSVGQIYHHFQHSISDKVAAYAGMADPAEGSGSLVAMAGGTSAGIGGGNAGGTGAGGTGGNGFGGATPGLSSLASVTSSLSNLAKSGPSGNSTSAAGSVSALPRPRLALSSAAALSVYEALDHLAPPTIDRQKNAT